MDLASPAGRNHVSDIPFPQTSTRDDVEPAGSKLYRPSESLRVCISRSASCEYSINAELRERFNCAGLV